LSKPLALLVNDDGVHSIGMQVLKERLSKDFDCFVVGPKTERSGIGKALTVGGTIRVDRLTTTYGEAYSVDGTPADAVLIAIYKLLPRRPAVTVAGINLGPNLGVDDILNSGTVGAAMEASIHGIPSIAVSYCIAREFQDDLARGLQEDPGLKLAALIAHALAKLVIEVGLPPTVDLISVNVPDYKVGVRGVRLTRPSKKGYPDIYVEAEGGFRIARWDTALYPEDADDTDVEAVRDGFISITPLSLSLTPAASDMKPYLEAVKKLLEGS